MSMPARPGTILVSSETLDLRGFLPSFQALAPDFDIRFSPDCGPLDAIEAMLCWHPTPGLAARLPNLKLIQSIAAGVDHILIDPTVPADVPVCRIRDIDMTAGMVAYVTWAVIHRQRHFDDYLARAPQGLWQESPIIPLRRHRVGIAGLGTLGQAAARTLSGLGYDVAGWSRSPKDGLPAGVAGYYGHDQLDPFLGRSDTLICLLPLTDETRGFLSAALFARLPPGAHLINVGRGAHLVEADLIPALESGQLRAATLDTFAQEPLPADHPFWRHPQIVATPHIATRTTPPAIIGQLLDNLAAIRAGQPAPGAIDRQRGY